MISIGRFGDRPEPAARDVLEAALQLRRTIEEGVAAQREWGRDVATPQFELGMRELLHRLEDKPAPADLLNVALQALQALETATRRAGRYFREQSRHLQTIVEKLSETIAEISAQSDASILPLQSLERQIAQASNLDDLRTLKTSLASCLAAVKAAALAHRDGTLSRLARLREHAGGPGAEKPSAPGESPPGRQAAGADYLAAFRLQRAGSILTRFGPSTQEQMLAVIGETLESVRGPADRLRRCKGPSFLLLLRSSENLAAVRRRCAAAVARIGQRYVEAGKNSALLAVGVDWNVFAPAQYQSPEAALAEAEVFLEGRQAEESPPAAR